MWINITKLQTHIYEQDISMEEYRKLRKFFNSIWVESYNTMQMFAALSISRLWAWWMKKM